MIFVASKLINRSILTLTNEIKELVNGIDYKKANSELTGVDTFEGILGYIVATVISNKNIQAHERSGKIYE